jgi:hypothetical protein
MTKGSQYRSRTFPAGFLVLALLPAASAFADAPTPAALTAYQNYVAAVEARLVRQHRSAATFLAGAAVGPEDAARLHHGDVLLEDLTPQDGSPLPGALLHHWRATAFVPGAAAAGFEHLLRDFSAYPRVFAPEVERVHVVGNATDDFDVTLRVRQHHVLTVVLDTRYDVTFSRLDSQHRCSISRSTRIAEIADPGTSRERALSAADDHGYLWRQNAYWSWEEGDGGLYLQVESVSLSRSIPFGLAWAVGPWIARVPRESLAFTLQSAAAALRRAPNSAFTSIANDLTSRERTRP